VLLDYVVIVQQPLAGRTDRIGSKLRRCCEALVYLGEYYARVVETLEKGTRTTLLRLREELVLAGNVARVLCQPVRTINFTANRADELSVRLA
jgi:hypothetical protein